MSRNPTLPEVLNDATQGALGEVYVSLPGRVVRYDAARQEADVQPIPKVRHEDETGASVIQQLPVIPSVPVQFPGGGGFTVTFPIAVGDTGLLVFSGLSMDKWLGSSGADTPLDPETHAHHALSDASFIPGLRSFKRPRSSMPTDHVRVGLDGAAEQGAALGAQVKTFLDDLKLYLLSHIHLGVTTGAGVSGPPATTVTVPPGPLDHPSVPAVESTTVKVTE